MNFDSEQFQAYWHRMEQWLVVHAPADAAALNPGTTPEELQALSDAVPFPLHPMFPCLLGSRNGVRKRRSSGDPGKFILNFAPLDSRRILEEWSHLTSMVDEAIEEGYEETIGLIAHDHWLPFAANVTGDLMFIDHRPGKFYGNVGETQFGAPEYRMLWPDPVTMLADLCSAVESGTSISKMPYVPVVEGGEILEWHVEGS